MTERLVRAINVRRPYDEVAAFVTDPARSLAAIPGFARFAFQGPGEDGGEEWDVFLEVGTFHVGGRVLIRTPSPHRIEWEPLRGTASRFAMTVEPLGEHARLTMDMTYSLEGLLLARISELLVRGVVARHLEAGLQEMRHQLEYGDDRLPRPAQPSEGS
jgi:carbon monoxide dehydrogenase subunit G